MNESICFREELSEGDSSFRREVGRVEEDSLEGCVDCDRRSECSHLSRVSAPADDAKKGGRDVHHRDSDRNKDFETCRAFRVKY